MCGIAGIHVKEKAIGRFPVDRLIDYLLLGIEPRGDHATGLVAISGADPEAPRMSLEKKDDPASKFVMYRRGVPQDTRTVLLHTRWATQGKPEDNRNNHPVLFDTCFAVHNGHINNDSELFAELGVDRPAEVDSIAIPACLSHHGMGELEDIRSGLEMLQGAFAIAAIDPIKRPGRLILAKGSGSPLIVINTPDAIVWASTLKALKDAWGAVLGTPPSRKATADNYRGVYDFNYGDLWVIDGDTVQRDRFQPAPLWSSQRSSYNQYGFCSAGEPSWYTDEEWELLMQNEDDQLYSDDPGWERTATGWKYMGQRTGLAATGGGMRVPRVSSGQGKHKRTWTCHPASWECIHPCTRGCSSMRCECYEENPDHPRIPGKVIDIRRGNTHHGSEDTRPPTVVQAECYSCQEDYVLANLRKFRCEDGEEVLICMECGEWEREISGELNVLKEHDSHTQKLTEYEKVAQRENTLHGWACKEVAFELNCSPEFVQWLLFEATDADLEDEWVNDMRGAVDREYINALEVVKATRELENDDG